MPFSGTVTRQILYSRDTAGSVTFNGDISAGGAVERAISGVLSLWSGTVTRVVSSARNVSGFITFNGDLGSRHLQRAIGGVLTFSGYVLHKAAGGGRKTGMLVVGGIRRIRTFIRIGS